MNYEPFTEEELEEMREEGGWDDEQGCECCPGCGVTYSANGGYDGPVWDFTFTKYESRHDSDPEDGPFLCRRCKTKAAKVLKTASNKSINDYL